MNAISPLTNQPFEDNINFELGFELTERSEEHKYIIRKDTDEVLAIMGPNFKAVSHPNFFAGIHTMLMEQMDDEDLKDVQISSRTARNGGWALQDITFPNVKKTLTTNKHSTDVAMRGIFWHGVDGRCANNGVFGAIDFFCTNGMVSGEYDRIRRKNTTNFVLESFLNEIRESKHEFFSSFQKLELMAQTLLTIDQAGKVLETLVEPGKKDNKKRDKMLELVQAEMDVRGNNVWAMYSAFTNYSSHANDNENGFTLRKTHRDTQAETMFKREIEVSQMISNPAFQKLIAA